MTYLHQPRSSFVIRIWWEEAGDSQPIWRGWVQHARSGKAAYVQNVEGLLAFIERRTGKLASKDQKGLKCKEESLCQKCETLHRIGKGTDNPFYTR